MPRSDLLGRQLLDRREDGREGHVDPHVDGAELLLDPVGRGLDGLGVGDVGGDRQGAHAVTPRLVGGALQAVGIAGQKGHVVAVPGKFLHDGSADAGSGTRHHDDLGHFRSPPIPVLMDEVAF